MSYTTLRAVCLVIIIALFAFMAMAFLRAAMSQTYLPPSRYTQPVRPPDQPAQPSDPIEYYAEDWVVLGHNDQLICRDPYIQRDIHVIKCISRDPVR